MRKKVCYIGCSESTCDYIMKQLTHFLGEYVEAKIWCLQHEPTLPYQTCDIYIAASKMIYETVADQLPPHRPVLTATRIIDTENLYKLLELAPGTQAIVVAVSEEAADSTISMLKNLGIDYLDLIPYYPNCGMELPSNITMAITPGVSYLVPRSIKKVLDVGVRGIDVSTFGELVQLLELPMDVTNRISHDYIKAILNLSLKHYRVAEINADLMRKMEVILKTVNEAIVAVNEEHKIIVFNPAAERLLDINSVQVLNKDVREVIPKVDFTACLQNGVSDTREVLLSDDNQYIVNINPINVAGKISGVVATFHQLNKAKENDGKRQREIRSKGNIARYTFSHIVGESYEVTTALTLARRFAKTDLTVLLEGESGTGKEVFAQAVHNYSERRNGPFVAVNFAAIPENLVESELFGYEDGAFTGAKKGGNAGLFEEANSGTIFIDEIGDASMEVQKRLLRVLEERKVRRVGSGIQIPIDVRVIAATNQDLEALVSQGRFRADLFYRLCALPISVPSLRERGNDIFILANYFARKNNNRELKLESPLKEFFLNYRWPGNIRELQNVVEYLCNMIAQDEAATIKHLPTYLVRNNMQKENISEKPRAVSTNEKFELLAIQLKKQDLLQSIAMILNEIYNATLMNKGVGRQAIQKNLGCSEESLADHKVRQWLKSLEEMGYIVSGKTKQGSKITKEGESFLYYLKEKYELKNAEKFKLRPN